MASTPLPPRRVRLSHALAVTAALIVAAGGPVRSQSRPAPPAGGAAQPAPVPPGPDASYSYDPAGRRDPFVSLLGTGSEPRGGRRVQGLAGVDTADLSIRGVLESNGAYVAMVEGPDGKTYLAHVNDRLADGRIKSITLREIVIEQDVNDPLSRIKQREVRKQVGGPAK